MRPGITLSFIIFLFFCSTAIQSKTYQFSAIEALPDQAVAAVVMSEIYKQLGYRFEVEYMPGLRAQRAANTGKFDGEVMRIFSYGNETPNVIRVPTPFYEVQTVAYIQRGSQLNIIEKSDLHGHSIAIVRGVKHTDLITRDLDKRMVKLLDNPERMMSLLNKGRSEIALTNPLEGELAIKRLGYQNLELVEKPLATLPLYHYLHAKHSDIAPLVDAKINELKQSGYLTVLLQKAEVQIIEQWLQED